MTISFFILSTNLWTRTIIIYALFIIPIHVFFSFIILPLFSPIVFHFPHKLNYLSLFPPISSPSQTLLQSDIPISETAHWSSWRQWILLLLSKKAFGEIEVSTQVKAREAGVANLRRELEDLELKNNKLSEEFRKHEKDLEQQDSGYILIPNLRRLWT